MSRILVIQTAFLGDIVLVSGFLRALRRRHAEANIVFLTTQAGRAVLTPNPWNIEIRVFDKRGKDAGIAGFRRIVRELRAEKFDTAFVLHRYFRSSLLARLVARRVYGFREASGAFLYSRRTSRGAHEYEAARYLSLLGEFSTEEIVPELFVSEEDEAAGQALLAELGGGEFLAIAPTSVWPTKRWQAEKFAAVARWVWRQHGLRTVIVAGNENIDVNVAGQVAYHYVHVTGGLKELEGLPLNLAGRTSLGTLKYVLSRAKAVVANDSAPLHIAAAMGRPVLGIFGPTVKSLGFFPHTRPGESAVAEIDLHCRPCGKHGHFRCPEAHFRCMLDMPATQVQALLEPFLCR